MVVSAATFGVEPELPAVFPLPAEVLPLLPGFWVDADDAPAVDDDATSSSKIF